MKQALALLTLSLVLFSATAQTLYTKAYGNSRNKPLILIHGGPGSSAISFEETTAQKLADDGFYVILYDRRGEGRSTDDNAKFTYRQTFDDLNTIYKSHGLKKATLIGNSFGGIIATLYAEKYPQQVEAILLVSSLLSIQETYTTILTRSKAIAQSKNDKADLDKIAGIEKMDRSSLEFRQNCFKYASRNGFFSTPTPNDLAKQLYQQLSADPVYTKYAAQNNEKPSTGFWKNEKYTTVDIRSNLKDLLAKKIKIYALYGKDDHLFSPEQIMNLQQLLGNKHLIYLDSCAHYVYIDQQVEFLAAARHYLLR